MHASRVVLIAMSAPSTSPPANTQSQNTASNGLLGSGRDFVPNESRRPRIAGALSSLPTAIPRERSTLSICDRLRGTRSNELKFAVRFASLGWLKAR
jgi:hypothetical protein